MVVTVLTLNVQMYAQTSGRKALEEFSEYSEIIDQLTKEINQTDHSAIEYHSDRLFLSNFSQVFLFLFSKIGKNRYEISQENCRRSEKTS